MDELEVKPKRKTKTSTAVKRRYNAKTYTRVSADLPKALVVRLNEATANTGVTTTGVIRAAVIRFVEEYEQSK
ncbi:hypothetical protein FACS1894219_12770 [Clostridia bacterium]|nr:hypothetical protein FACS1894219_12770 [Clostridia bacterium]